MKTLHALILRLIEPLVDYVIISFLALVGFITIFGYLADTAIKKERKTPLGR